MEEFGEFIVWMFDKEMEDQLWAVWLNKDIEQSFAEYKDDVLKRTRVSTLSYDKSEIQKNFEFAAQFITPRKEEADG